jgi:hypothetical protein
MAGPDLAIQDSKGTFSAALDGRLKGGHDVSGV